MTGGFIEKLLEEDLPLSAIEWLEDPLPSSGDWRKLRERCGIPLASDEAFSPAALVRDEAWDKFDVLVVKPERFGPIAELEKVCARAKAEGKKVVFSSMYASGVGLAHIAALAGEYGSHDVAHGLGTSDVFLQDTLTESLEMRAGRLIVPPLDELAGLLRPEWRERLGFTAA
jgi:L-alanine-DL-glutamate epimerase-like enolase superfamily enzyme